MTDTATPYDALKNFNGLIRRQSLFASTHLQTDVDHLMFLDTTGSPLAKNAPLPDFLSQLPQLLSAINHRSKVLLTVPQSWQKVLCDSEFTDVELIITTDNQRTPVSSRPDLSFASYADNTADSTTQCQTLLIDFNHLPVEDIARYLPQWRQQHAVLCALNVDAPCQFNLCQQHDIDLIQGIFYTLPADDTNKTVSPSAKTLTQLLVKLQDPEIELDEMADIINQDVALSYKLLRLINSAFFGLPREVGSTRQAIVMLGQNKIKTWASLLCLSGLDNKPSELRYIATIRGRMCELLAKYYKGHGDVFFAAGLFSVLDALMDKPLEVLLQDLPLSEELHAALLSKEGPVGKVLQTVLHYERGNWKAINHSKIPQEALLSAYLDSLYWAKELNQQLNG